MARIKHSRLPAAAAQPTIVQEPRFDLSMLYKGIDDPAIKGDLTRLTKMYKEFDTAFRGRLGKRLGDAIEAYAAIMRLENKLTTYSTLLRACKPSNGHAQRLDSRVTEAFEALHADHAEFFALEIGALSPDVYKRQVREHPAAKFHAPFLRFLRKEAKYNLSEKEEEALTRRDFVREHFIELYSEGSAQARYTLVPNGALKDPALPQELLQPLSEEEIRRLASDHPDRAVRALAQKTFNEGLKGLRYMISRSVLNAIVGLKGVEDEERGYKHPMREMNISNRVSDAVVKALHEAVATEGAALAERYYKLLARCLKVDQLLWSDRNARVSHTQITVPWDTAVGAVREALSSISETFTAHFDRLLQEGRIEALPDPSKEPGAFCLSTVLPGDSLDSLPGGIARAFVFMSFMGRWEDVLTLAHEAGHAVHDELAGDTQGVLMQTAPLTLAETASTFVEAFTFDSVLSKCATLDERLALLMQRSQTMINTVVRQIALSVFEQQIHSERKDGELSTERLNELWMEIIHQFFGPEGDVFSYADMDAEWACIDHFHDPFYCYSYAFGGILAESIRAKRKELGHKFEPLYLDLLRAGDTKDVVKLLKPLGLNPADPNFWRDGLRASLGRWIDEAERIANALE